MEEGIGTGIIMTEKGTMIETEKGKGGIGERETEIEKDLHTIRPVVLMRKTPIRTVIGIAKDFTCQEIIRGRTRQFYREQCFTGT